VHQLGHKVNRLRRVIVKASEFIVVNRPRKFAAAANASDWLGLELHRCVSDSAIGVLEELPARVGKDVSVDLLQEAELHADPKNGVELLTLCNLFRSFDYAFSKRPLVHSVSPAANSILSETDSLSVIVDLSQMHVA